MYGDSRSRPYAVDNNEPSVVSFWEVVAYYQVIAVTMGFVLGRAAQKWIFSWIQGGFLPFLSNRWTADYPRIIATSVTFGVVILVIFLFIYFVLKPHVEDDIKRDKQRRALWDRSLAGMDDIQTAVGVVTPSHRQMVM